MMFEQLGNFMKLGAEIQEEGPTRHTITSMSHGSGDRRVPYDVTDHEDGRVLRLHTDPPTSFRIAEELAPDRARVHRLPDSHLHDGKPATSGHCTIHECSPHHVDVTIDHEGKDVRCIIQHDRDGWIMSGMPKRPDPAILGGEFVRSVVKSASAKKIYAVDLDGTLAFHPEGAGIGFIGRPIPAMLKRVRQWIADGHEVRIFTARAADPKNIPAIRKWLDEQDLRGLRITNAKDIDVSEIWDDRAVRVERNTGKEAAGVAIGNIDTSPKPGETIPGLPSQFGGPADIKGGLSGSVGQEIKPEVHLPLRTGLPVPPRLGEEDPSVFSGKIPPQPGHVPYSGPSAWDRRPDGGWRYDIRKSDPSHTPGGTKFLDLNQALRPDPNRMSILDHGGGLVGQYQVGYGGGKIREFNGQTVARGMAEDPGALGSRPTHILSGACNGDGGGSPQFYEKLWPSVKKVTMAKPNTLGYSGNFFSNTAAENLPFGRVEPYHDYERGAPVPAFDPNNFGRLKMLHEWKDVGEATTPLGDLWRGVKSHLPKLPAWPTPAPRIPDLATMGGKEGGLMDGLARLAGMGAKVEAKGLGGFENYQALRSARKQLWFLPGDANGASYYQNKTRPIVRVEPEEWKGLSLSGMPRRGTTGTGTAMPVEMKRHELTHAYQDLTPNSTSGLNRFAGNFFRQSPSDSVRYGIGDVATELGAYSSGLKSNAAGLSALLDKAPAYQARAEGAAKLPWMALNGVGWARDRLTAVLQKFHDLTKVGDYHGELHGRLRRERPLVDRNPSEAQQTVGNFRKGHVWIQGLDITIESPKGSVRKGIGKGGVEWSVRLSNDYGYIRRMSGRHSGVSTRMDSDGDHCDVFVGPHPDSAAIFGCDQFIDGKFDEIKVVIGAKSEREARDIYLANYSKGWKGLRNITALTVPQFKNWLARGDTSKPLAGQYLADFHKKADSWYDPMVAPLSLALLTSAARGALTGGAVGLGHKLYNHAKHKPDDTSMAKDILIGTGIGAATNLALHYVPPLVAMVRGDQAKAAHFLDPLTAPAWIKPMPLGIGLGALYGAGIGGSVNALKKVKRWVMGESTHDVGVMDGAMHGALMGGGISAGLQLFNSPPEKQAGWQSSGLASSIVNDPNIPSWRQAELIRDLERAEQSGIQLTPTQLYAAGFGGLAGWLLARMGGAGAFGQMASGMAGAWMGAALTRPDPTTIYGDGYYRP